MRDARSAPSFWAAEATLEIAGDPELLDLMRETNCKALLVGIETINRAGSSEPPLTSPASPPASSAG